MKYSWSRTIFFAINQVTGKYRVLDSFMIFCAMWLIFILGSVVVYLSIPLILFTDGDNSFFSFLVLLLTTLFFAIAVNWLFAYAFPHPRPIVEFPKITQLLTPMSTWKSFPSDHTTVAFIFALFSTFFFSEFPFITVCTFLCASVVAFSRIYVGVHYPRDIVGGIVSALFFFVFVVYIMSPYVLSFFVYLNSLLDIV
ncbi:MAG: phosphatase PAP2 family protein [Candidatus Magasanikbacteria bacterium]|nr:phosphatase PAP2 family protein [Candidatus Magasanikbacteria bacterium]NCS72349.1 phosphatase PAP2 family protein [Candidatus Magasanikbacteria bacterium]